jgi:hypothetical protein
VEGGTRRCWAAAWPAASSAAAHRRGPLPQRGQPASACWRSPPSRTPVTAAARADQAVLPRRASLTPRRDHNQGRTSSLRCGRSTLILIFHGKIRRLSGGRAYLDSSLRGELARGVIPVTFCGTPCLTCCRCLPCLLASQTALTPPAKPLGKPGLHHSHLPLLHGRVMASQAGRLCSACWSRARDARQRQRTGTVQTSSVRPPLSRARYVPDG